MNFLKYILKVCLQTVFIIPMFISILFILALGYMIHWILTDVPETY